MGGMMCACTRVRAAGVPLNDARALAYRLLTTVYLGTVNSSKETRDRSRALAKEVRARLCGWVALSGGGGLEGQHAILVGWLQRPPSVSVCVCGPRWLHPV